MVAEIHWENTVEITDDLRWNLIERKASEHKALLAFSLFRSHSIEPILIKGLAAARFYPDDKPRGSVDMDLAVHAADYNKSIEISQSPDAKGLAIDLHRELRHLDTVSWDDLFENSELVQLEGGTIRVLRPEDHLRVLCVHWLNDGGANRERLWDIYYIVANRSADFDWDRFLNTVSPRRRRWLAVALGLANRYLGLDLAETPVENAGHDIPSWIIRTVEHEWKTPERHLPLDITLDNPKLLGKQLLKRLRPNPIWATVEMEGSFDARTRLHYQIGSVLQRAMPSLRRIVKAISDSKSR